MPTTRPRHQVTETPAIARALDLAAKTWPQDTRAQLIVRVLKVGSDALERSQLASIEAHRRAVRSSSGKYAGAFGTDYLRQIRKDWPVLELADRRQATLATFDAALAAAARKRGLTVRGSG